MNYMNHYQCKVCGNKLIELITYKNVPSGAWNFSTKEGIDLPIYQCAGCGLVQIPAKPVDYYKSAFRTPSWFESGWRKKQLKEFKETYQVQRIKLINEEPEPEKYGAFLMPNYLEHFPEPVKILSQIRDNLEDPAVGIIDVPNFDLIYTDKVFYEFVIDHLFYFTKNTLEFTLRAGGFEVLSIKRFMDNYVLSATVRKRCRLQAGHMKAHERYLRTQFQSYVEKFNSIAVWGAGHQACMLLTTMGINDKVKYVVDSSPEKQGKYTPVSNLPIKIPETLINEPVQAIIVLVGGFYESVFQQIQELKLPYSPSLAVIKTSTLEIIC